MRFNLTDKGNETSAFFAFPKEPFTLDGAFTFANEGYDGYRPKTRADCAVTIVLCLQNGELEVVP